MMSTASEAKTISITDRSTEMETVAFQGTLEADMSLTPTRAFAKKEAEESNNKKDENKALNEDEYATNEGVVAPPSLATAKDKADNAADVLFPAGTNTANNQVNLLQSSDQPVITAEATSSKMNKENKKRGWSIPLSPARLRAKKKSRAKTHIEQIKGGDVEVQTLGVGVEEVALAEARMALAYSDIESVLSEDDGEDGQESPGAPKNERPEDNAADSKEKDNWWKNTKAKLSFNRGKKSKNIDEREALSPKPEIANMATAKDEATAAKSSSEHHGTVEATPPPKARSDESPPTASTVSSAVSNGLADEGDEFFVKDINIAQDKTGTEAKEENDTTSAGEKPSEKISIPFEILQWARSFVIVLCCVLGLVCVSFVDRTVYPMIPKSGVLDSFFCGPTPPRGLTLDGRGLSHTTLEAPWWLPSASRSQKAFQLVCGQQRRRTRMEWIRNPKHPKLHRLVITGNVQEVILDQRRLEMVTVGMRDITIISKNGNEKSFKGPWLHA